MLKSMSMHKLVVPVIGLLLGIGVILTGIGFAMERNIDYLKEEGSHKWYQIIYVNQNGDLRVGISFEEFDDLDIPHAPSAPQAPVAP